MNSTEQVKVRTPDIFGDGIKKLEMEYAGSLLNEDSPFCVRIDGKAFHSYTKGLKRPYDERLSSAMINTMNFLLDKSDAKVGYTQSDEISLVFFKTAPHQQNYFGSRVQKLTSVLSSMATAIFNQEVKNTLPEKKDVLALFDARVWSVPTLKDAADVLVWRQEDAIKNAVSMAASAYYSPKALHGKSSREKIEMLAEKGISWTDYPDFFKSGTYSMKKHVLVQMDDSMKSFSNNKGKENYLRSEIVNFSLPRLKKMEDYTSFLFDPVFAEHKMAVQDRTARKKKSSI